MKKEKITRKKQGSLRRRWLMNTVGIVCALGLVCVLSVTAAFAAYYYSAMESDMRLRARNTAEYFADNLYQNYNDYYQSCITYAQTFEDKDIIEFQFLDERGQIIASSYGEWAGISPETPEIREVIDTKTMRSFIGTNPQTGERIMAISSPMLYGDGQLVGVLRYVTSTQIMDGHIAGIAAIAFAVLLVVVTVVLLSSNYYIRSILVPLDQIVEKAKMITSGSYGFQIKTRYNDEVGRLAETINEMSNQISRNEKTQTEFISSLSHELRTPLTAITGWSETLLNSEDLDEGTRRGMMIIHREADRLTEMVVDLLDFTRIQDGRMTLNMELTDIRAEFEDTVFMYGSRLSQDGIQLEYLDNDQDIPEVSCDPKRLRQVFLNILDNASKHGGEGKRIDAQILYTGEDVQINIRDYGPGIPEDEIPLVKKKFYKGSSKARGSGIGLAVCDEIVQMHGGSLTLSNAPGGGTLVAVRIPASQ